MTDDEAHKILDFLARKLGCECMQISDGRLYIKSKTNVWSLVFQGNMLEYDTIQNSCQVYGYHEVCGNSYVDALENILQDCQEKNEDVLDAGHSFMKIPHSLEEIRIMMDLEDEICMDDQRDDEKKR